MDNSITDMKKVNRSNFLRRSDFLRRRDFLYAASAAGTAWLASPVTPGGRLSAQPAEARGHRGPRIFIFHVELDQGSKAKPQTFAISLRKRGTQKLVQQEP